MSRLAWLLATWFGCGLWPKGPGTAGALGALLAAWMLSRFTGMSQSGLAVLTLLLTPAGMWAADRYAKERGLKDPGSVVIDEVLGQWIPLCAVAVWNWQTWLGAFLLFRLFDIWKPAPVRQFEQLKGGVGIVADDLMAGVYAALVLRIVSWVYLV